MVTCFPHASRSSRLPSVVPSVTAACFWLVVVLKIMRLGRRKPRCIFHNLFLVFLLPLQMIAKRSPHTFHHGRTPSPISSPQQTPTFGWLLCFPNPNGSHLRPRPRPPHCFLMGCISAPKTREPTAAPPNPKARALHGSIGSGGTMSWWRHSSTHGGRGPKPLGGRAVSAHFGCCVLCGCVCVVVCAFSYQLVESQYQKMQNG